ncbi:MAG TPA: DUF2934 domain-containing protein [Bryobacteraceae bacterium]|jgi:hypothetical protein|nr:DUF2934 domain-containing protein [Bryobacteraceae bacterium]
MAEKQTVVEENVPAAKKTAAKKIVKTTDLKNTAPRVKAAAHRKAPAVTLHADTPENPRQITPAMVAATAYGYWQSRGYQGGDPVEDWFRAESELRQKI